MFDMFDVGVMECVRWRLMCVSQIQNGGSSQASDQTFTLRPQVSAVWRHLSSSYSWAFLKHDNYCILSCFFQCYIKTLIMYSLCTGWNHIIHVLILNSPIEGIIFLDMESHLQNSSLTTFRWYSIGDPISIVDMHIYIYKMYKMHQAFLVRFVPWVAPLVWFLIYHDQLINF